MTSKIKTFEPPHKGIRNILSIFSFKLGSLDIKNQEAISELKQIGNELKILLADHLLNEEKYIFKEIENKIGDESEEDKAEHERLEEIEEQIFKNIEDLSEDWNRDRLHNFYLLFSKFHSEYLSHILHEELITEKILQENFSDEELASIPLKSLGDIPPTTLLLWFKYCVPARSIEENLEVLTPFFANAPIDFQKNVWEIIKENCKIEKVNILKEKLNISF